MLDEMRQLVQLWDNAPLDTNRAEVIRVNPLNKATRARVVDVLNRIFIPRFVNGPIKNSWTLLAPLERLGATASVTRPIYFWLTAISEPLMYDFCCEFLAGMREKGINAIHVSEASGWIRSRGNDWSDSVTIKVTRALLAALRDFGVLQGRTQKHLVTPQLPLQSFAYIAFCLDRTGVTARRFLFHPDWKLFMLTSADVEHLLLDAHQHRFLEYQAAGSVLSLSFPASSPEEYANVVLG